MKADKEHIETVKAFNEKVEDWRGTCRYCREMLKGTIEDLKKHRCNNG